MSDVLRNILNLYYGCGNGENSKRHFSSYECSAYSEQEESDNESPEYKNRDEDNQNFKKNKKKDEVTKIVKNNESGIESARASHIFDNRQLEEESCVHEPENFLCSQFYTKDNNYFKEKGIFTNSDSIVFKSSSFSNTPLEFSKSIVSSTSCRDTINHVSNVKPVDTTTTNDSSDLHPRFNETSVKKNDNNHFDMLSMNMAIKRKPVYNETYLDLTNTGINVFPLNFLNQISNIRMLYLENNNLSEIPDDIFTCLKHLEWLDVRRNKITAVPKTVKGHESLDTILLQTNKIEMLPLELGLVPKLKRLQITDNPLIYPPEEILKLGCAKLLDFLRNEWNIEHPEEKVKLTIHEEKIKPASATILCYQQKINSKIPQSTTKVSEKNTSVKYPKQLSTREKSWNYKMSNRCKSNGTDVTQMQGLLRLEKVTEIMNQRARILQRMLDKRVLKEWRQSMRSFEASMAKAAKRSEDNILFDINMDDTLSNKNNVREIMNYVLSQNLTKKIKNDLHITKPPVNIDKEVEKIMDLVNQLQNTETQETMTPKTRQNYLLNEFKKISQLQGEIQFLKRYNKVTVDPLTYEKNAV